MAAKETVKSPCIRNCCLDRSDLCMGCFRTLEEICEWHNASDERKLEIRQTAKQRRKDKKSVTSNK